MLRDGRTQEIDTGQLVVGDVLLFDTGDILPADGMLFQGNEIRHAQIFSNVIRMDGQGNANQLGCNVRFMDVCCACCTCRGIMGLAAPVLVQGQANGIAWLPWPMLGCSDHMLRQGG